MAPYKPIRRIVKNRKDPALRELKGVIRTAVDNSKRHWWSKPPRVVTNERAKCMMPGCQDNSVQWLRSVPAGAEELQLCEEHKVLCRACDNFAHAYQDEDGKFACWQHVESVCDKATETDIKNATEIHGNEMEECEECPVRDVKALCEECKESVWCGELLLLDDLEYPVCGKCQNKHICKVDGCGRVTCYLSHRDNSMVCQMHEDPTGEDYYAAMAEEEEEEESDYDDEKDEEEEVCGPEPVYEHDEAPPSLLDCDSREWVENCYMTVCDHCSLFAYYRFCTPTGMQHRCLVHDGDAFECAWDSIAREDVEEEAESAALRKKLELLSDLERQARPLLLKYYTGGCDTCKPRKELALDLFFVDCHVDQHKTLHLRTCRNCSDICRRVGCLRRCPKNEGLGFCSEHLVPAKNDF